MLHRIPSIEKVAAAIGWQPERSLDEILADVIEHERSRTSDPAEAPAPRHDNETTCGQMLQETVDTPLVDARPRTNGAGVLTINSRRRPFSRAEAIALPGLCIFVAANCVVLANGVRPAGFLTAAILAAVFVSGLVLIGRSTWLSPLALGVPVTAALGIIIALPVI